MHRTMRSDPTKSAVGSRVDSDSDEKPLVGAGESPSAGDVAKHTARMLSTRLLSRNSSIPPAWRSVLARHGTPYSLSCFTYTLIGILSFLQWWQCPQSEWWWPRSIAYPECLLVTAQVRDAAPAAAMHARHSSWPLQGVWSYWSDVIAVGTTSWGHCIE